MSDAVAGIPEVGQGASTDTKKKDEPPDIRQAFQFTQDWMANRPRVTYRTDGSRVVQQGPTVQLYDEQAALGLMGNLKPYEGAIDELKRDLWWAGFYGDKPPSVGGDMFDRDDLVALYTAMDGAELQGGVDVISMVGTMAETGRARNAPLGVEVDPQDDPGTAFRSFAKANGIALSDRFISDRVGAIGMGTTTIEQELASVREKFVKTAFPAWADDIAAGTNIEDIASPYRSAMSQLLEIPEDQIDLTDPTLRSALQSVDGGGKPTYKPLWLFERELRKDTRWQYTDNAYKAIVSASDGALREMGF